MKLLVKRNQASGFMGKIKFSFWAQAEVTEEERELLKKYSVDKAVLWDGNEVSYWKWNNKIDVTALFVALTVSYLIGLFFIGSRLGVYVPNPNWSGGDVYGFRFFVWLILIGGWISIRHYMYHINVISIQGLLNGKSFKCGDVATLLEKENLIKDLSFKFRCLLEMMKTWGEREIIEIRPCVDGMTTPVQEIQGAIESLMEKKPEK